MTLHELERRLAAAAASSNVEGALEGLVETVLLDGAPTIDSVKVILEFMERHDDLDLGTPGPLAHFAEKLHGRGYEGELLASIARCPTGHTVWMLNRVINGTTDARERHRFIAALVAAGLHPRASEAARDEVQQFLEHQRPR